MGRLTNLIKENKFKDPSTLGVKEKTVSTPGQSKRLSNILKQTMDTPSTFTKLQQATKSVSQPSLPEKVTPLLSETDRFSIKPTITKGVGTRDTQRLTRGGLSQQRAEEQKLDRIERTTEARTKEETRKSLLSGAEERLQNLIAESNRISESPEPDAQRQNELTKQILETRNVITANQPGFQTGLRESIGLEPTARFGAQQATPERAEQAQQALETARTQSGFGVGRVTGELAKQAALYATVGSALKGTQFFQNLGAKLGGGKVATFAADQIADLFVDTVIQLPQEIARKEDLATIGWNRLIDIGMNLGIGAAGEGVKYFRNLKQIDPSGFEQALKQIDPQTANAIRNTLETKVEVPSRLPDTPQIQAFKESEVLTQPQLGPVKQVVEPPKVKTIELYGDTYKLIGEEGTNYKAIDATGQEMTIPKSIADEAKILTDLEVVEVDVRNKANELLYESSQSIKGGKYDEGFLKSDSIDSTLQRGEVGDFVPADPSFKSDNIQDLLDRKFASDETALRNRLNRIVNGTDNAGDKPLKEYIKTMASDTGIPKDFSTTVDNIVDKPKRLSDIIKGEPTSIAAKIEEPKPFSYTIPLDDAAKRTQDGLKERGFSANVRTDEAIAKEINADFDADPLFYEELANATTLERAQARFNKGYEEAIKDFDLTKTEMRADNVVLAKLIANEAAARGELDTARRIISDTAEQLTTAGQYSQAARILRESNDPASIITYIEKELKKLNDQGVKRYGTEKPTLISKVTGSEKTKGWKKIDLTDADKALIESMPQQATDAQKQELFEQLYKSISDRIPTTKREKFDAWRRIAMLTNPKTHIRNIVGNGIMAGVKKLADTTATGLEQLLPQAQRTKSINVPKQIRDIANNYWDANKSDLADGSRWEIFGVKSPFADKKIFNTKALETINNFSKNTLEGEDIFFLKRHFTRDLAGFMNARGLTEPTQEAVEYALRRAQEATFRQQNALAEIIAKGKKSRYGFLVEAAVPFSKTPANIAQTSIDYSPLGVLKAASEIATNQPPAKVIETFSKGLTGSGLSALGAYMAFNGLARGSYRRDADEEGLMQRAGILPNSIQLPTGSYTIDWAQPAAVPFFMGVAFAEELKNNADASTVDKVLNSGVKGLSTIFDQTMLSGIADIFSSYDSEGIVENIAELPLNYIAQTFPTIGGQIARTVDPTKRERDYTGLLESFASQTRSKIPGLSLGEPAKRDIFGEEIKYGEGISNALQQFLSPGYFAARQDDPLTSELVRLYNEVGKDFLPRARVKSVTFKGNKYTLTPEERSEFQRIMGEYTQERLQELLGTVGYQTLDDESKAEMIKNINDAGYDLAKEEYLKKVIE